ncbi:MAG TPA: acyl-CoA desaturase, partial [Ferruginibacter sp.]|nr:acyl-CoA desaturase [Ferruginibacter sp.]
MKTSPTPKFRNKKNSNFHQELKKRVQEYFDTNNKKPTGNYSLYFKAGLFWVIYIALYVHVV